MTPLPDEIMPQTASLHPLDQAIALTDPVGHDRTGQTHPAYANMIGPFGGITAATLLQAVMTHPERLGEPVALTINYAGAVEDGEFLITAIPVRTNRSTQHWTITLTQNNVVMTTATAVFALRRETWSATETPFPDVPKALDLPRAVWPGPSWLKNYDFRLIRGMILDKSRPEHERDSITQLWMRDDPPRTLDFVALSALCDAFAPRIMVIRPQRIPAGTVSITTYFHATGAQLAAQGTRHVLGSARATRFAGGYHDQIAEVWGDDGTLLATSHQIVYFKE